MLLYNRGEVAMSESAHFQKVKQYYERGLWRIEQVQDSVAKGWITAKEYAIITGTTYKI